VLCCLAPAPSLSTWYNASTLESETQTLKEDVRRVRAYVHFLQDIRSELVESCFYVRAILGRGLDHLETLLLC
jgi:hypothetical protein